jgi:NAD(P)-dependent dehydrogenase (short-subunit alcohol dehydrogenase family)
MTQQVLPLLRAAGQKSRSGEEYTDPARIINVSGHWQDSLSVISLKHFVQIGSVEGLSIAGHETYSYAASKAGLHHMSRHFASRLGGEGITSNTIACGPFETKSEYSLGFMLVLTLTGFVVMAYTLEHGRDIITSGIPLNRIGRAEDVAGTALFLASSAGSYVNGATIALDGGLLVSPTSKL